MRCPPNYENQLQNLALAASHLRSLNFRPTNLLLPFAALLNQSNKHCTRCHPSQLPRVCWSYANSLREPVLNGVHLFLHEMNLLAQRTSLAKRKSSTTRSKKRGRRSFQSCLKKL